MPTLDQWDPQPAVLERLKVKFRRNIDRPKGKQQDYFKGIFKEALPSIEYTEITDEEKETSKKKQF